MKKLLLFSLCLLLLTASQLYAQNRTITGTITGKDDGQPIPGASVRIQGTNFGTQTDVNGHFSLSANDGQRIIVSFIGYDAQTFAVGTKSTYTVVLAANSRNLAEVQITGALGIKRQAKELGYAATNIDAKTLTETHPTNFTNGLTAKAPGLVISTLDNGINPSTRFTLRGNRHINGNNYALVVLNGVPVSPNTVNDINPDDIESVNILNGSGAAALYGSEASNGALVITTKHGNGAGQPQLTYTNTFNFEKISYFPKLQTTFGSYGGEGPPFQDPATGLITTPAPFENQSYGPAYNGQVIQLGIKLQDGTAQMYPYATPKVDPRYAFFNTGHSDQHNVSYSAGDALNSFNFSANRLDKTGVVPNDSYNRSAFRVSGVKTYGILKVSATAAYTKDYTSTYGLGYDGSTLLSTLFNTPSWVPLQNYKDPTQPFADPNTYFNSYGINPYWIVNNSRNNTQTDNFGGSFTALVTPTKWFDAQYTLSDNSGTYVNQTTRQEVDFSQYAHNDPTRQFGASYGTIASVYNAFVNPGTVSNYTQYGDGSGTVGYGGPQGYSRLQQDFILGFHRTFFNDFKTNLRLGNTVWQEYANYVSNGSSNLLVKDFYNIGSILGTPNVGQGTYKIRQLAYFGDLTIGYKDFAFLEGTIRNEHDSRLSKANRSFYYPSVTGSFVFTQAVPFMRNNSVLNYGKIRAVYSQVGDVNVNPYSTVNTFSPTSGFPYGNQGGLSLSTTLNNPNLKPELSNEFEIGTDLSFFNSRINVSASYYNNHTKNQTLTIATSPATGYSNAIINVGEVQSTGFEFKLDAQVLPNGRHRVGLNLSGNLSIQNSNVISLFSGLNQITLGGSQGSNQTAITTATVGLPFTALYVNDILRDPQGRAIVDATTGYPQTDPTLKYAGRTTPKYILGLTQTITYDIVSLNITSEFRTGNVFFNQSLYSATAAGTSAFSAQYNRQRFIFPNSVIQTAPGVYTPNTTVAVADGNLNFWDSGAYYYAGSTYTESAAFWKLREADLNFNLTRFINNHRYIKGLRFSLIGRNLVMLRPKTNNFTDPEYAYSGTNGGIGYNNTYQLPPTRIFGASVNVTF